MPDVRPSKELTDRLAREQQAKDPTWKKLARNVVDIPANLMKGFMGQDPDPNESTGGYLANVLMQFGQALDPVAKAGLPFLAATKGKPVYHGARQAFEKFDYSKLDSGDILGKMVHFAENPEYANEFAHGAIKTYGGGNKPNIIPAHIDAKNILDLSDKGENFDDFSQALAGLTPVERKRAIDDFKYYQRQGGSGAYDLKRRLSQAFQDPSAFKRTPFDAIKYDDIGGHPSFAVPEYTGIKTPYGAPLNEAAEHKPLGVIKTEHSNPSSLLKPTENFEEPKNLRSLVSKNLVKTQHPNSKESLNDWASSVLNDANITFSPTAKKINIKPSKFNLDAKEAHFGPNFGILTEKEAQDLVKGGEIPMSTYMKKFGHIDAAFKQPEDYMSDIFLKNLKKVLK